MAELPSGTQRALVDHPWPHDAPVSVRMGLHTGEPFAADHGFVGVAVHRAARICTIAHGGQVLLSRSTAGIVDDEEIAGVALRDLGEHGLKDIDRPERIFQLVIEGLPSDEQQTRRTHRAVRVYELVVPLVAETTQLGT